MKKINISRLQDRFIQLVTAYMQEHGMTQQDLAKTVGIQRTHVNALLNSACDRPLTAYYLWKFIMKGVVKVNDIQDGKGTDGREKDFWEMASEVENIATLKKIAKLRKAGFDIDKHLDFLLSGPKTE
jgi:hypothetical protein